MTRNLLHVLRPVRVAAAVVALAACASGGTGGTGNSGASTPEQVTPVITGRAREVWPVKTREQVDLWLHGFALISTDSSATVPLFRRGYVDEVTVLKNRANVYTQLDANRAQLRQRVTASGNLLNAQFVPFYFSSVDEMLSTITRFVEANGQPQARSQDEATRYAVLASYFGNARDRTWLALFASSLADEQTKFFHSFWIQRNRERANVIDSVNAVWSNLARPRLTRFLTNTRQRDGDLILSLPLGGEGRSITSGTDIRNASAVTFPSRPADAAEAVYVVVHELTGAIATTAVSDNVTPAQQREGAVDRLASPANVRAGLMLLEKYVPELADGYARFYLTQAGRPVTANPRAALAVAFPTPDVVRDEIARSINTLDSGI